MQSPVGKIVSIEGQNATVTVERTAACPRCASGRGCGAGLLSGSTRPAVLTVTVPPRHRLHTGDEVRLALEPSNLLHAALLVYGVPLAATLAMLALAWALLQPLTDAAAVGFAFAGLGTGLAISRWQLNRRLCLKNFVPKIDETADVGN